MKTLHTIDNVWVHQPTNTAVFANMLKNAAPARSGDLVMVEIISVCDWHDAMGYDYLTDYSVTCDGLRKYLAEHTDTTYWSAPREEFFYSTAAEAAAAGGFTKVIVEDLS